MLVLQGISLPIRGYGDLHIEDPNPDTIEFKKKRPCIAS